MGMSGAVGAAKRVLVEQATKMFEGDSLGSMKFWDYVGADVADRIGCKGDRGHSLISERGGQGFPPEVGPDKCVRIGISWPF